MKNFSKKTLGMLTAAALSVAIFASTAMAASHNVSGYEKVRESMFKYYDLMNEGRASNFTLVMGYSVKADGEDIASAEIERFQQDRYNYLESTEINVGGITRNELNSYNNGIYINYDDISDVYSKSGSYIEPYDGEYTQIGRDLSTNERRLLSILFDMFAGDAKNYCTMDGDVIMCRLERGQIPEFFQALIAVVSEDAARNITDYGSDRGYSVFDVESVEGAVMNSFVSVIKNASFEAVDASGVIDETGMLNDVKVVVTISGSDSDGTPHELDITVSGKLSELGSTVAQPIDTTDKNVIDNTWTKDNYEYEYNFDYSDLEGLDPEIAKKIAGDTVLRQKLEDYYGEDIIEGDSEMIESILNGEYDSDGEVFQDTGSQSEDANEIPAEPTDESPEETRPNEAEPEETQPDRITF